MKEEFLHFLWKNRLYSNEPMLTSEGELLQIIHPGWYNRNAGPDFFDARVRIGQTLWAGNIEIHVKSSDWDRHGHQHDPTYHNTILHVVAHHDADVYVGNGSLLPVIELTWKKWIEENYLALVKNHSYIGCASQLYHMDRFRIKFFLNGMMIERLQRKVGEVQRVLNDHQNDWNETFYCVMARYFGLKENTLPFEMLARLTPLAILLKHRDSLFQIEALLFGQSGLLGEELFADDYYLRLRDEYRFLAIKYDLKPIEPHLWKMMRMRPGNFPTLRLAQFAKLLFRSQGLFQAILEADNLKTLRSFFDLSASSYWETHYHFNRSSPRRPKNFGDLLFQLIVINVVVPFIFLYGETQNKLYLKDRALALLQELPAEQNRSIRLWSEAGIQAENALESQALLQLQNQYCEPRRCLECTIGHKIITHEPV